VEKKKKGEREGGGECRDALRRPRHPDRGRWGLLLERQGREKKKKKEVKANKGKRSGRASHVFSLKKKKKKKRRERKRKGDGPRRLAALGSLSLHHASFLRSTLTGKKGKGE